MQTLEDRKLGPFRGLLWGAPKSGKTVFVHQFPGTRTLEMDPDGMESVVWAVKEGVIQKELSQIPYESIRETSRDSKGSVTKSTALDRITDTLDEWHGEQDEFHTIIADSASALSDFSINKGLDENARLKLSKSKGRSKVMRIMRKQDWGAARFIFQQLIDQLLANFPGKNIILTAHRRDITDDEGSLVETKPELIGGLREMLPKDFSEVWYFYREGSRKAPEFKIQTSGGGKIEVCGSRLGCLDPVMDNDYEEIVGRVSKYFGVPKEELWKG